MDRIRVLIAISTIGFCVQLMAHDDLEEVSAFLQNRARSCVKANASQKAQVNSGLAKWDEFLVKCYQATNNSTDWCEKLTRPNPDSFKTFQCTYGKQQPHVFIHPDDTTWLNAFSAVNMIEELTSLGVAVCNIYNWWRPEPYNRNVGGSPTRHPFGTAVDVRFCSLADMELAFTQLCEWRAEGRLKALGYYGTTGLHFGIADSNNNTWGKPCHINPSDKAVIARKN